MRALVLLCAFALVTGCHHDNGPNAPPPDVVFDDTTDGASSPCARACAKLSFFACPEGAPSRGGVTCTAVCQRNADLLPVACVNGATDVAGIRACGVRCQP